VLPPLTYTEYRPSPDLVSSVACIWQITGQCDPAVSHRVLPDGCADLLFDLEATRCLGGSPAQLVGPMTGAKEFALHGAVDFIGIRLRPGVVGAFSAIPAHQVVNTAVPFGEFPPSLRLNLAELAALSHPADRVGFVSDLCRFRLSEIDDFDPTVQFALTRWARAERGDLIKVALLARDLGLSERAFERRFVAQVGLVPVHYRRLARFRSVLRLYATGTRDWARLAAICGFSDQAHLVRDFRQFAALTPTAWAATQAPAAGFLQDGQVTAL
jgi:AraC-like DNA-binding protein